MIIGVRVIIFGIIIVVDIYIVSLIITFALVFVLSRFITMLLIRY